MYMYNSNSLKYYLIFVLKITFLFQFLSFICHFLKSEMSIICKKGLISKIS